MLDPTRPATPQQPPTHRSMLALLALGLAATAALLTSLALWCNQPPLDFPVGQALTIAPGSSGREIIADLKAGDYIRSTSFFYFALVTKHGIENIKAGTYDMEQPLTALSLARLLTATAPPEATVSITLPEGYSIKEYALIADRHLDNFDSQTFMTMAQPFEGTLFPDTYEVPADFSEAELLALLRENYETKIADLRALMAQHKLTEEGIINLASIVEREANTPESMRMVAGILDKRLALGMPLQADATMEYILDKPLRELTAADLDIDTPYNTYLYKGLPPTPIGNPGLTSIMAVIEPEVSDFLFYLTDEEGTFHYAKTYEAHQDNIARYLR